MGSKLFVSGRACIVGEHSDWAAEYGLYQGMAICACLGLGVRSSASQNSKFAVELPYKLQLNRSYFECDWDPDILLANAIDSSNFFRYTCASALIAAIEFPAIKGATISIQEASLPIGKGLASSAAICILVLRAFNHLYGLQITAEAIADLAFRAERITGSSCGRMDQVCVYDPGIYYLVFKKGAKLLASRIQPRSDLCFMLVDLGGRKDTVAILSDLQHHFPDASDLQNLLGNSNERFVNDAREAIELGDQKALGVIMSDAQKLFDDVASVYSPAHLSSPLLHNLLSLKALRGMVWGMKGMGSQGDGMAQLLLRKSEDYERASQVIRWNFPSMSCFKCDFQHMHQLDHPRVSHL